jgi:electron transfer flavoprotein-quinone oxidoreductase
MVEQVDTVVVGAGPAGSATAYALAQKGQKVLLVERAKTPGEKNVSGGMLCGAVLHELIPKFWEQAPLERCISNRRLIFVNGDSSFALDYSSPKLAKPPYSSYSVIRYDFDRWFAEQAEKAGAILATGVRVDRLVWENGRVRGVQAGTDEIHANVVVAADGVNSILTEQAGLRRNQTPDHLGIGIKEVVQLPPEVIDERFNLTDNEGAAHTYIGCTQGVPGGGFLYTNRSSLSFGVVLNLATFKNSLKINAPEFIDHMKQIPAIERLLQGGDLLEYSAHLVPESGYRGVSKLYTDGFLVTGDAAGLAMNTGYALEGMNLAIASGIAAAHTIQRAAQHDNYTRKTLKHYQHLLNQSFVLSDLKTFRNAHTFLNNRRLQKTYPELINNIALQLFSSTAQPRPKMVNLLLRSILKEVSLPHLLLDGFQAVRGL